MPYQQLLCTGHGRWHGQAVKALPRLLGGTVKGSEMGLVRKMHLAVNLGRSRAQGPSFLLPAVLLRAACCRQAAVVQTSRHSAAPPSDTQCRTLCTARSGRNTTQSPEL